MGKTPKENSYSRTRTLQRPTSPSCPSPTTPSTEHMHLHILLLPTSAAGWGAPAPLSPGSSGCRLSCSARPGSAARSSWRPRSPAWWSGRWWPSARPCPGSSPRPSPLGVGSRSSLGEDRQVLVSVSGKWCSEGRKEKAKRGAQSELQHQRGSSALGPALLPLTCSSPSSSSPQGCSQDQTLSLTPQSLWWDSQLWCL